MQQTSPKEKTSLKTYRHYSVPPATTVSDNKKLQFFYVGKKTGDIDMLIRSFDSGYAAESADQARVMLKKITTYAQNKGPDVIIADGTLGHASLLLFSQHLSSQKQLRSVPFVIEGASLGQAELEKFRNEPFADDIISLEELGTEKLIRKVRFWTKVKEMVSRAEQPLGDDLSHVNNPVENLPKRIFDIVISALLLILLIPVFLLIMLALRIESKGPVFYVSKRAGKGYRIFNFYKFRTMDPKANDKISDFSHLNIYNPLRPNGPVFIKIDNDPRVTRLGAWLRRCSLDELPQLLNVLKGDMSLVGNRPLPLYEAATLTTDQWAKRFMAPAGMTGLWQIRKNDRYKMTAEERITLDISYADRSNFLFDLWIMANTPSAVIQRTNA